MKQLASLWVCWGVPTQSLPAEATVLSFLPSSQDEELQRMHPGAVILAREASRAVRSKARELYVHLVARIGLVKYEEGRTLRQALARSGEASRWWYHPVAFKDCESDPTFNRLIAVLTVRAVAEKYGMKRLMLCDAPSDVAEVLKSIFEVKESGTRKPRWLALWLRGFVSRAWYAVRMFRWLIALRTQTQTPCGTLDVVFSGFWDWSVWWDQQEQLPADRFFKCLPGEFERQGVSSIGWFAWFDPHSEPGKEGRRLKDVLAPLNALQNVVILQAVLRPWEIIRALGDFEPLAMFLKVRNRPSFREVFRDDGINYYALFSERLLAGFVDASLPRCELVAVATARVCHRYQPKATMSFLEHYPHSRAHYEGVRRAGLQTINYAVQHASYCHEKTFLFLHTMYEFQGEPDGCPVPHPDYVCAMGILGQELFEECGYPKERVLLTGSPRYDHVRSSPAVSHSVKMKEMDKPDCLRLLIVTSLGTKALGTKTELDMVEAVSAAARGIAGIELLLRSHPFRKLEQDRGFARFKGVIESTTGPLEEDILRADLIVFTYSTVAEEAYLLGKPVWQWLPLGFNGSALAETVGIPQFGSVANLREALRKFQANPDADLPSVEEQRLVLTRLFNGGTGGAARIATAVGKRLRAVTG